MDSCHLFNFLFGTRKTTSELRKCFSQSSKSKSGGGKVKCNDEKASSVERKSASFTSRASQQPHQQASTPATDSGSLPSSPLKQIQLKIANLASGASSSSLLSPKSSSVFSTPDQHEITRIEEENDKKKQKKKRDETPISSNEHHHCPPMNGIYAAQLVKLDGPDEEAVDENNNNITDNFNSVQRQMIIENPANKLPDQLGPLGGQGGAINLCDHPLDLSRTGQEVVLISDKTDKAPKISKSKRVKSLVETFEIPSSPATQVGGIRESSGGGGGDLSDISSSSRRGSKTSQQQICQSPAIERAARQRPPQTPPKSNRAKCLNLQLCLNKPSQIGALFQNETFLRRHFFDKLEPLDRCSAAQVCRTWRNTLYANKDYWKDLVGVIDCTQLRREHLVECILSTLHAAKLKHGSSAQQRALVAAGQYDNSHHYHSHSHPSHANNNNHHLSANALDASSAYIQSLTSQLDQDEIWRIQELCNRYTARNCFGGANGGGGGGGSYTHATSNSNNRANSVISTSMSTGQEHTNELCNTTTTLTNQTATTTSGIAQSKSTSSQISSSTLSSMSISSLLSPLSESSRVDSIREKLYTALDERGFDSICLCGATDDDIDDLARKTRPSGAQRHIRLGRLSNCSISDKGLQVFATSFGQLEELELTGCNEITNAVDLRGLANLRRLIITDCINIADGFAQRLVEIFAQLDVLVLQAYHLTDAFLEYVTLNADTSRLRRLELPNCKEITNNSALTIAKYLPQLESLSLSGSAKINDDGAEILGEHMKALRTLDLGWMKMGDFALECLACDMRELREIILDRNTQITDAGLSYLAGMPHLSLLYVRWCPQLTDASVEALAGTRSLRHLSLAGLHQVTARGLLSLVDARWLEELELTNCPAVTGELLQFLAARLPGCNIVF